MAVMAKAAQAVNVPVAIGPQTLVNPALLSASESVASGAIGRPLSARSSLPWSLSLVSLAAEAMLVSQSK
jgi:predicted dehydrogenase